MSWLALSIVRLDKWLETVDWDEMALTIFIRVIIVGAISLVFGALWYCIAKHDWQYFVISWRAAAVFCFGQLLFLVKPSWRKLVHWAKTSERVAEYLRTGVMS